MNQYYYPAVGKGHPLQYSGMENSMDYVVHSPWGCKESDMTETLSLSLSRVNNEPNHVYVCVCVCVCVWYQINQNWGKLYKVNDLYSSKIWKSWKKKKIWQMITEHMTKCLPGMNSKEDPKGVNKSLKGYYWDKWWHFQKICIRWCLIISNFNN